MQTVRHGRDLAGRAHRRDGIRRRRAPRRAQPTRIQRSTPTEIVAHELRTPLTSLLMGGAMLLREDLERETRRQVVLDVVAEGARLAGAIEDLLALVADDQPPDREEPLSVGHLLRAGIARLSGSAPGVTFRLYAAPDLPVVIAPEQLVSHLVHNLLVLAHATADPDGIVEVVAAHAGGDLSLRVTGGPRTETDRPPRHAALTEAASRVLATRLGADLRLATTRHRFAAMLSMPAVADSV